MFNPLKIFFFLFAAQTLIMTPALTHAVDSSAASSAIASADGETSGVHAEVTELKRDSGGTVSLKFVLINDSDNKLPVFAQFHDPNFSHPGEERSVGGIYLVDAANQKKYLVVRDTRRDCVCSKEIKDIPAKSRVNLWAKFPAPPADVKKIGIVIPHFPPMDDVPISQ
jgi:hypothetical protein